MYTNGQTNGQTDRLLIASSLLIFSLYDNIKLCSMKFNNFVFYSNNPNTILINIKCFQNRLEWVKLKEKPWLQKKDKNSWKFSCTLKLTVSQLDWMSNRYHTQNKIWHTYKGYHHLYLWLYFSFQLYLQIYIYIYM